MTEVTSRTTKVLVSTIVAVRTFSSVSWRTNALYWTIGVARNLSWGHSWGPKGRNSRPKAESGGEVLGEPPPHKLGVWGSTASSPSRFWGRLANIAYLEHTANLWRLLQESTSIIYGVFKNSSVAKQSLSGRQQCSTYMQINITWLSYSNVYI